MSSALTDFLRSKKARKFKPKEKKEKGGFTMRPLKLLARTVAIKRGGMPVSTREVTKGVVDDQKFAVMREWNQTCVIVGGPGEGKSRAAYKLGKMYVALTGGSFDYCWDIDEIPNVPDGGWVHVDEWLIPEGPGRVIALQRVKNRFDTARAKQISISVSTPTAPELPFVTFELTALAQDFDSRRNIFEVRVPLPRYGMVYIGNAILPVGEADTEWLEFERKSKARKDKVWDDKGAKKIEGGVDVRKAAKEVMKWVKDNELTINTKGQATTYIREVAKEKDWDLNYYNEPDIVNWVMILNEKVSSQKMYTGQVKDLRKALFKRLEERGVNKKHVKMMLLYVKGDGQTDIAKKLKVTQEAVSQATGIKSKLRLSVMGKAFEDVWAAKLHSEGKIVKKYGGNSPEPDILIFNKEGEIIEVQSLKCQITKSTTSTVNRNKFAVSEIKLWESGIPLKLVYFDVVADKIHIVDVDGRARYKFTRKV